MRNIQEILNEKDPLRIMTRLSADKPAFTVPFERVKDELDPYQHKVMNPHFRKKKVVKVPTGNLDPATGKEVYKERKIERCRVSVPVQRVIVERSVGFLFSNPVEYKEKSLLDDSAKAVMDEVRGIFDDNKMEYFDKRLARHLFAFRECAELWYFILDRNGKPEKMRVRLLSPALGDELYPHFDDYDRMDGFARKYSIRQNDGLIEQHFDIYTSELVYQYVGKSGTYELQNGGPVQHGFGKVPVIYYRQEHSEWADVQANIERLEELLSNWGDTNDYYGTPSYYVKGALTGFAEKGEVGRIYTGEANSDMRILSWDSSPESMRTEMASLLNIIFSYTQTPDISFESMKTLGNNTSGAALRLMFTDPHMKAAVKTEQFGEKFTRRFNVVMNGYARALSHPAVAESTIRKIKVKPVFTFFIPQNVNETIDLINKSTGGKATMSQAEGVRQNPLVFNPDATMAELQEEAARSMQEMAFAGAVE